MLRSSSRDTRSPPPSKGLTPSILSRPLLTQLSTATSGLSTRSSGSRIKLAGKAMRSGCSAAMVFGVTSAKIRMTRVRRKVATTMPASPYRRMAMTVAMAEAAMLTRLLPMRIRPISRSGRSSKVLARTAPRCLCLRRCFRRWRLSDIMPVSELEKKPDRRIRAASTANSNSSGALFKCAPGSAPAPV